MIIVDIIVVGYFIAVIFLARIIVREFEGSIDYQGLLVKQGYQELSNKHKQFKAKKNQLEHKASEMFTLYELTKEITKSLNEEEAFANFKTRLKNYVPFTQCQLVHPPINEDEIRKGIPNAFIFPLQAKEENIGYLVLEGVSEDHKDIVKILGSQFALALRRVKLYEALEQTAITDSLTQVNTRRYSLERFEEELERSRLRKIKMSLLMIDVDYFKKFNDTYGHLTGDQILREVGRIIKESIRQIDIAGRYGGEEFCVLLPDTDREGARFAAERIRQAMERTTIKAYDAQVKVTVSIGVATFPDDGDRVDVLLDKADWALYRAKKTGRNRVCLFGVYKE